MARKVNQIRVHAPSGELGPEVNHRRLAGRKSMNEEHRGMKRAVRDTGPVYRNFHPDVDQGCLILSRDLGADQFQVPVLMAEDLIQD